MSLVFLNTTKCFATELRRDDLGENRLESEPSVKIKSCCTSADSDLVTFLSKELIG